MFVLGMDSHLHFRKQCGWSETGAVSIYEWRSLRCNQIVKVYTPVSCLDRVGKVMVAERWGKWVMGQVRFCMIWRRTDSNSLSCHWGPDVVRCDWAHGLASLPPLSDSNGCLTTSLFPSIRHNCICSFNRCDRRYQTNVLLVNDDHMLMPVISIGLGHGVTELFMWFL